MKRIQLIIFLTFALCSLINAQQLHYSIDEAHSHVKFIGLLADMMEVEGKFSQFNGEVFFDPEHPEQLSVTVVIDPNSLNTDNEWRDKHLRGDDFLNTEEHDMIIFQSNQVTAVDKSLTGQLLLKGKKRPISIEYKKEFGPIDDPWQNKRITFTGSFTFSRTAFDLGPTESFWGKGIADEAKIVFTISATRKNMERMSIFKNEQLASIWDKIINNNTDEAIVDINKMILEADEKTKERIPKMIDLLAKRSKQHNYEESYTSLLELNVAQFPELDWVYSEQALGFWENGNQLSTSEAARKALAINPKNALALELLKD